MNLKFGILMTGIFIILASISIANADVWIPDNEFTSYYDTNGVFTVVGAIKNSESSTVVPTITINISDNENTISESFKLTKIYPTHTLPFKLKFPDIKSKNVTLQEPQMSFETVTDDKPPSIEVLYDDTLIVHDDGHQSGRIVNTGSKTLSNIKVYALIHDKEFKVLDMGQSWQIIDKIKPGEIREFTIYPDPSISDKVAHYSCFDIGADTVIPINVQRKGQQYGFRYDSVIWFAYAKFNEAGDKLTMKTQNSWPLENYANFEFPRSADDEKFNVLFNNQQIDFIQSIDEMGNWHVAFILEPHASGEVTITGFKDGTVTPHEGFDSSGNVITKSENRIVQSENNNGNFILILAPIGIAAAVIGAIIYKKKSRK